MFRALNGFALTKLTATAATVITGLIPPKARCFTRISRILYRPGATAHTIVLMKALGKTTLSASVALNATAVVLSTDPGLGTASGAIATNDFICVELDDGTFYLAKVTMTSLSAAISAIPAAATAGNRIWTFGAPGDHTSSLTTVPKQGPGALQTALKGSTWLTTASVMNDLGDFMGGICQSTLVDEPMMVHSDNGTNAGVFELVAASHTIS